MFLLTVGFNEGFNLFSSQTIDDYLLLGISTRLLFYFLIFVTFFTLYEVGYIVNDCVSAKEEVDPEDRFIQKNYWKTIVLAKIISFLLLSMLIYFVFKIDITFFFAYNTLILVFFIFVHNKVSVENRGISYFWLEFMRLMIIPITIMNNSFSLLLISFVILPEVLRRTLRYQKIKLQMGNRKFNIDDLRAFLISSIAVIIYFYKLFPSYLTLLILPYSIIISGILASLLSRE